MPGGGPASPPAAPDVRYTQPLAGVDLDGDRYPDRIEMVQVARRWPAIHPTLSNPWDADADARSPPMRALRIALRITNSATGHVWLLHGAYLDSIADMGDDRLMTAVRRTSRAWRAFRRDCPVLRDDGVQMLTQAGIDIALYWTAGRCQVCWPNEVP